MQLINAVEYLSKINNLDNVLFVTTKSDSRKHQILELLEKDCFSKYFPKVVFLSFKERRISDFCLVFIYCLYIRLFCLFAKINVCILGNYRDFLGRYLYKNLSSRAELIVVDDGLATMSISEGRNNEIESKASPFVFFPNRILSCVYSKEVRFIPNELTFFTIYNIKGVGLDSVISNTYSYLRDVMDEMNIPSELQHADVIFLGQPLYHNILSFNKYSWYLKQYAKSCNGRIIYYPHPEEQYEKWKGLKIEDKYNYIENKFSIELLLRSLKNNTRIISFFSSAIVNARFINQQLVPEVIYLSEIDYIESLSYLKLSYNQFENSGIRVVKYEYTQDLK